MSLSLIEQKEPVLPHNIPADAYRLVASYITPREVLSLRSSCRSLFHLFPWAYFLARNERSLNYGVTWKYMQIHLQFFRNLIPRRVISLNSVWDSRFVHRINLSNTNLTDQDIRGMASLATCERISLACCPKLTDLTLQDLATRCTRLRVLNVSLCYGMTNLGVNAIRDGCLQINLIILPDNERTSGLTNAHFAFTEERDRDGKGRVCREYLQLIRI